MKGQLLRLGPCATLMVASMLYGMLSFRNQLPPFWLVFSVYKGIFGDPNRPAPPIDEPIPAEYFATDVARLITIREPRDVVRLRGDLLAFLWGTPDLPASEPSRIVTNVSDSRYEDIHSLTRIDELVVQMEFGLESHAYHFLPKTPNNQVVIYHQGHDGDFYNSKGQIRKFLDSGYTVVALCMPLFGLNNQPTVQLARFGNLKVWDHDPMKFLSPESGHPIKFFVEPVVTVLNYLDTNFDYSSVAMVGISGGGWTTTLAAAIDTRIARSFPVAGSYPLYLRSNSPRDWGDFEQTEPALYSTANYLELYVLGANGAGRKQLQIINRYDSCCFAGTKWRTYNEIVAARVAELGPGEFDLFSDDSHQQHFISDVAMDRILDELANSH